ncbi:hypothetical protein [Paenibacillus sp. DMB5]|uniref:hypothetical protein n=1 Tax=Paenibacillus sp. DMB5 TaxID=1780103 RepID=UPI00076CCD11|nr:hypothetical protein [Paenibacillus sp. DMB5]KUP25269.1 hypothetical protein AWJ19_18050 [Paenibacillus sp. DMB5]
MSKLKGKNAFELAADGMSEMKGINALDLAAGRRTHIRFITSRKRFSKYNSGKEIKLENRRG